MDFRIADQEIEAGAGVITNGHAVDVVELEFDGDQGALANFRLDGKTAIAGFGGGFEQGKPEPHFARGARGDEGVDNARCGLSIHAFAVILDKEAESIVGFIGNDSERDIARFSRDAIFRDIQEMQGEFFQ